MVCKGLSVKDLVLTGRCEPNVRDKVSGDSPSVGGDGNPVPAPPPLLPASHFCHLYSHFDALGHHRPKATGPTDPCLQPVKP